jgi:hypothetical protein
MVLRTPLGHHNRLFPFKYPAASGNISARRPSRTAQAPGGKQVRPLPLSHGRENTTAVAPAQHSICFGPRRRSTSSTRLLLQVRCRAATSPMPALGVEGLSQLPYPQFQPLAGSELGSFAHGTISKRLPSIVETIITEILDVSSKAGAQVRRRLPTGAQHRHALHPQSQHRHALHRDCQRA